MQLIEANGAAIPALGLGTMTLKGDLCVDIVGAALKAGYRHLDTAQMYGNETEVGQGLRASGIERGEVFVTTKVWFDKLGKATFLPSVEESLKKLNLASVDLLLIHWNNAQVPIAESVAELCKAKRAGYAKHIGVANFPIALIEEAVAASSEPLVTNQIEVHPFLDQRKVIAAARRHGLSITAYCPLARGKAASEPVLQRIGAAHGKSAGQAALRWLVQRNFVIIPRTSKKERLAENMAIFDFSLSDAEMAEIAALARADGRLVNPPHHPRWDD